MEQKPILVIDDEKNIRLTMVQALETLQVPIQEAADGEEALGKLRKGPFALVFLDLKLPGMDGLEVLRQIKAGWPHTRVIVITAHGTIDSAVEAMKLGAADFIRKPFSPAQIRELATQALEYRSSNEGEAIDYLSMIALARRHIAASRFSDAGEIVRKAIAMDPGRPEAFNLLGALYEIKGDALAAQKFYRAALDVDPAFKPAWTNLNRTTSWNKSGGVDLGQDA
jgi:CheY-like chemotaxis protein